jgi:hypothetical protein
MLWLVPGFSAAVRGLESMYQSVIPLTTESGQILGIWLNHSYAHTHRLLNYLPHSLKGADMSLYETVRALGLEYELVPVMPC